MYRPRRCPVRAPARLEARTFTEKVCQHHRQMGTNIQSGMMARFKAGVKDYSVGNHPLWQVFRTFYQIGTPLDRRRSGVGNGLCLVGGSTSRGDSAAFGAGGLCSARTNGSVEKALLVWAERSYSGKCVFAKYCCSKAQRHFVGSLKSS